jgi:hypothetical protein
MTIDSIDMGDGGVLKDRANNGSVQLQEHVGIYDFWSRRLLLSRGSVEDALLE